MCRRPCHSSFLYISLIEYESVLRAALGSKFEVILARLREYEAVSIGLILLIVRSIIHKVSVSDITHILLTHFYELIISNVFLIYFIYLLRIIAIWATKLLIFWLFKVFCKHSVTYSYILFANISGGY